MLGEGLGARGHNVTIFSPYFVANPPEGVQYLFIENQTRVYEEYSMETVKRDRKPCAFVEFAELALLTRKMCFSMSCDECA